jgi:hypothetical protein
MAQVALVALLWNVEVWPPVPAYQVILFLAVPFGMLFAALVLVRSHRKSEMSAERGVSWRRLLTASAWNSLASLASFFAIAYLLNIYGYVRAG